MRARMRSIGAGRPVPELEPGPGPEPVRVPGMATDGAGTLGRGKSHLSALFFLCNQDAPQLRWKGKGAKQL